MKKELQLLMLFIFFLDESNSKPNKIKTVNFTLGQWNLSCKIMI